MAFELPEILLISDLERLVLANTSADGSQYSIHTPAINTANTAAKT